VWKYLLICIISREEEEELVCEEGKEEFFRVTESGRKIPVLFWKESDVWNDGALEELKKDVEKRRIKLWSDAQAKKNEEEKRKQETEEELWNDAIEEAKKDEEEKKETRN